MLFAAAQRWKRLLQADDRLLSIFKGSATGVLARLVALGVGIITLPLNVRYMGRLEYGIWVTISGTVVMLNLLDLGIASTLTNFLSKAFAENNKQRAQEYYATAFWLTTIIAILLGCVSMFSLHVVDLSRLFHVADPVLLHETRRCIIIAVVACLLNLPLNLANKVAGAYRELHLYNYFSISTSLLTLLAIVIGTSLHFRLSNLMLTYCAASVVSNIAINVWMLTMRQRWLKPVPWRANRAHAHELFGQGMLFFILQLCGVVVFNSDNLIITHYVGPTELTPYSVAWRLASYASVLQQLIIPAAWPVLSEAYQSGDLEWVRSTYRNITHKSWLAVGSVALVIGLFGRLAVRIWAGDNAVPSAAILWSMALWSLVVCTTTNQALLLSSIGRLKLETTVAVLAAVANLLLSIYLVQRIGTIGVILGTITSFLVLMLGPQQWEVNRVLKGRYLPAAKPLQMVVD